MSGLTIEGLSRVMFESTEPQDIAAERREQIETYSFIKVVGLALKAIASVGAVFAALKGMVFFVFCATLGLIGHEVEQIGSNGVSIYTSSRTILASSPHAAMTPENAFCGVLYSGTVLLGTTVRYAHEGYLRAYLADRYPSGS